MHDIEVKRECVAAYLGHIRELDEERMKLEETMQRLESSLSLGAIRYSDMPKAHDGDDKLAEGVAKLLELRAQWASIALDAYREHGVAMAYCFATIPRRICWMYYEEHTQIKTIAIRMTYDRKTIMRKRDAGVEEIYEWMPEEWRRVLPSAQPWEEVVTPMSHEPA